MQKVRKKWTLHCHSRSLGVPPRRHTRFNLYKCLLYFKPVEDTKAKLFKNQSDKFNCKFDKTVSVIMEHVNKSRRKKYQFFVN